MIESSADTVAGLSDVAVKLRRQIVEALYRSGGGHYGGALSVLDILLTLYCSKFCGDDTQPGITDRILLSKGHAAIALYAVLQQAGLCNFPLESYGSMGSALQGHPDMTVNSAVEFSTGSLGQGLSVGLGMAIALHERGSRVWVVMGDGECQEGQVWEAAMLSARCRASNLTAIIDANNYQEYGWNPAEGMDATPVPELARKWEAFGWRVVEADGHDHRALARTFRDVALSGEKPTTVIAHTVKGYGCRYIESDPKRFHCTTVNESEHLAILRSLR
jgi:transketolase